MSSVNKHIIVGRLGDDPDVRYTQSNTAVANMSIATSEKYKDKQGNWQEETEWHRVVAWGRLAEICQEYLKKGSQVYVEGPSQTRQWEDKEGRTRYTTETKALTLTMLGSKSDGQGGRGGGHPANQGQAGANAYQEPQGSGQQNQGSGGGNKNQSVDSNVDLGGLDDIDDDLPF